MFCQRCGLEVSAGANFCIGCGFPAAPRPTPAPASAPPQYVTSNNTLSKLALIILCAGGLIFIFMVAVISVPNFHLAQNKSRFKNCVQSMNSVSGGLQNYLTEKNSYDDISDGNGEEICNYIFPAYDRPEYCSGKVQATVKQHCRDYNIAVNLPANFQYEITGHSNEKMECGICVTEDGYCPTSYTGKEPPGSRCIQSCAEAGPGTPAVCLH